MTSRDMELNSLPVLHPDRIREALRALMAVSSDRELVERVYETSIAALELVRKGQLAVGLTGEVVDAVGDAKDTAVAGMRFLRTLGRMAGK